MKTKIKYLSLVILMTAFLTGCFTHEYEFGNGSINDEIRTVPSFNAISSSGNFDVYFEYNDSSEVTVSCESNLIQYIETAVFENELKIRIPSFITLRPTKAIEIYVRGPQVESIKLSGAGLIHTDSVNSKNLVLELSGAGKIVADFYGENLFTNISGAGKIDVFALCNNYELNVSGSGDIELFGSAKYSKYRISGSGSVKAYKFPVLEVDVNVSGSGSLFLNVEDKMKANISGSGSIHYLGYPSIESNISGTGRLFNMN